MAPDRFMATRSPDLARTVSMLRKRTVPWFLASSELPEQFAMNCGLAPGCEVWFFLKKSRGQSGRYQGGAESSQHAKFLLLDGYRRLSCPLRGCSRGDRSRCHHE